MREERAEKRDGMYAPCPVLLCATPPPTTPPSLWCLAVERYAPDTWVDASSLNVFAVQKAGWLRFGLCDFIMQTAGRLAWFGPSLSLSPCTLKPALNS